ncbi:MAG: hypothetical protein CMN17_02895 [Roseovarius sp.]|nr:hypothetical protein [Roseovarius sp.]|tara:strand:- start:1909 stop:2700 length:792 start_codon:yes stop_codon:yes gene_type:complete
MSEDISSTTSLTEEDVARLARDAVSVRLGSRNADIVLLCEHGGFRVPAEWNNLGIPEAFTSTHFGYDIGSRNLTLRIAELLDATVVLANYSRLFLDYNRKQQDPSCIRPDMGGIPIPGNERISAEERALRERIARHPVEKRVADLLEGDAAVGKGIISIHSFSHVWETNYRDCEIGVMWKQDERLKTPLMAALRQQSDYAADENEPYSFADSDWFTLDRHGLSIGVPNAYIEVRNDLLSTEGKVDKIAKILAPAIGAAFKALN